MEIKRVHCLITGRVQGFGFRYFIKRLADVHTVCGRVRNLTDGRVEAVFVGARDTVELVVRSLQQGPSRSEVTSVAARDWNVPLSEYKDFQIESDGTVPWQ